MAWNPDDLRRLADSEELRITSYRDDGSMRSWTPIWVVRVGDDLYIRSGYGTQGVWYRNAMRHHRARVRANGVETDVTIEPVSDGATIAEVDAAYRAKYHAQPSSLRPMISPPATETTTRLVV
jgi:hypothetical protein